MIGIAFWNVHKNPDIDETIQNLILEKRCDMFILVYSLTTLFTVGPYIK